MVPEPPCVTSKRADARFRNRSRSSAGSPSRSQITRNDTGNANVCTRSTTGPCRSIASSRSSTTAATIGRSRSSRCTVNSGVNSLRSRVWSGGSVNPRPPMSPLVADPRAPINGRMSLLKLWVSASTARASASPVTIQMVMPRNDVSRWTGSVARVAPMRPTGSTPSRPSGQVSRAGTRSSRVRSTLRAPPAARTPRRTAAARYPLTPPIVQCRATDRTRFRRYRPVRPASAAVTAAGRAGCAGRGCGPASRRR